MTFQEILEVKNYILPPGGHFKQQPSSLAPFQQLKPLYFFFPSAC